MQTRSSPQRHTSRFHRRRFVKHLVLGVLCLMDLDSGVAKAEDVKTQNDREFAEVIAAIASVRKANRSTAIDVTPQFKPMTDRLSLAELKNYILNRYEHKRVKAQGITYDFVSLDERGLKSFDGAFFYLDSLRMTFGYSNDGNTVTIFKAVLLNGQL